MLCRNIAAGWDLSVQRGRAKASIWGTWAGGLEGMMTPVFLSGPTWEDFGESMTKVGLWGTRFIADDLAPFWQPSGRDKPWPRATCLLSSAQRCLSSHEKGHIFSLATTWHGYSAHPPSCAHLLGHTPSLSFFDCMIYLVADAGGQMGRTNKGLAFLIESLNLLSSDKRNIGLRRNKPASA